MAYTDPKETCLLKRPAKKAQRGLVWERWVVSLPFRRKPHTVPHSWDSGAILLRRQLIFRGSSFSSPFQKVLFFVYAAQFLYRRLHLSIPLIMFNRTLLGDMETLSFHFHRCDRMYFLKLPQNWPKPVFLWGLVLFPYLD